MAKAKVGKINIRSVNSVNLAQPLELDIFFEGRFFIYTPDYLVASIKPEDRSERIEGNNKIGKKRVPILIGDSPDNIRTKMFYYLDDYFKANYTEEKIIHYNFRFNSSKHYQGHNQNISFADTPAMSLNWGIHYLITFSDGRKVVMSDPYKSYGNLCTNRFDKPLEKYTQKWIPWTEEREQFFANTEKAMEALIDKVNSFFSQDPLLLATAVDNKTKLIG